MGGWELTSPQLVPIYRPQKKLRGGFEREKKNFFTFFLFLEKFLKIWPKFGKIWKNRGG
jgi:hypothetical protein